MQCSTPNNSFLNVAYYKEVYEIFNKGFLTVIQNFIKHEANFSKYTIFQNTHNTDNGKFIPFDFRISCKRIF